MGTGPCSGDAIVVDDTLNGQMRHRNAISFESNVDSDGISSVAASPATLVAFHGRSAPSRSTLRSHRPMSLRGVGPEQFGVRSLSLRSLLTDFPRSECLAPPRNPAFRRRWTKRGVCRKRYQTDWVIESPRLFKTGSSCADNGTGSSRREESRILLLHQRWTAPTFGRHRTQEWRQESE